MNVFAYSLRFPSHTLYRTMMAGAHSIYENCWGRSETRRRGKRLLKRALN